jgi:hypothetical protein
MVSGASVWQPCGARGPLLMFENPGDRMVCARTRLRHQHRRHRAPLCPTDSMNTFSPLSCQGLRGPNHAPTSRARLLVS